MEAFTVIVSVLAMLLVISCSVTPQARWDERELSGPTAGMITYLQSIRERCPGGYKDVGNDGCIKIIGGSRDWNSARVLCQNKYLIDSKNIQMLTAGEYGGSFDFKLSKVWISLQVNQHSRLIWNDADMTQARAKFPTKDSPHRPRELSSLCTYDVSDRTVSKKSCFLAVTSLRRGSSNFTCHITPASCTLQRSTVCWRPKVPLLNRSNDTVAGCVSEEYSHSFETHCFIAVKAFSSSVQCQGCPAPYSLYSPHDELGLLNVVYLSKMTGKYDIMMGIYRNSSGVFTADKNKHISSYSYIFNKSFKNLDKQRIKSNETECLAMSPTDFLWRSCESRKFYIVCSRIKTLVEPTISLTFRGESNSKPKNYVNKEFNSSVIIHQQSRLSCASYNSTGPLTFQRNGARLSFNIVDAKFAEGCYRCADWNMRNNRVFSNTICLKRNDVLRFVFKIEASYAMYNGIPFGKDSLWKFRYLKETLTNDFLLKNLKKKLFHAYKAKERLTSATIYLTHITLTRKKVYRLVFNIQIDLNQTQTVDLYERQSITLFEILKLNVKRINIIASTTPSRKRRSFFEAEMPSPEKLYFLPIISGAQLKNSDYCLSRNITNGNQVYNVASTKFGQYTETEICKTTGVSVVNTTCGGDPSLGAEFQDVVMTACLPFEVELEKVFNLPVNKDTVSDVIKTTNNLIKHRHNLTSNEIITFVSIVSKVSEVGNLTVEAGNDFTSVFNELIRADRQQLHQACNETNTTNSLLNSMDHFTKTLDLNGRKSVQYHLSNLHVQLVDLEPGDRLVIGLEMSRKNWRQSVNSDNAGSSLISSFVHAQPKSVSNVDTGMYLPKSAIQQQINSTSRKMRLVFVVQYRSGIFPNTTSNDPRRLGNKSTKYLNTAVISTTISENINDEMKRLGVSVRLVFSPTNSSYNPHGIQCVFWDTSRNHWSGVGCDYTRIEDGRVVCECDHLTNFAVLMGRKFSDKHKKALGIISMIGLILSAIGLSLTVITFIIFPKIRKGRPEKVWSQTVLFALSLTLLNTNLVFLTGIERTEIDGFCIFVAALLHYLLLASFLWMLTEAVLQYLLLVKVLGIDVHHFILKASLVCMSVPAVGVITVLSVDYRLYLARKEDGYCWLDPTMSYWVFMIPVAVILLINFGVFAAVLRKIITRPSVGHKADSRKKAKTAFYIGVACTLLMGLTWLFGYLTLIDPTVTFSYIFTIFNTLHGLFIFVFFTLRNPEARQYWRNAVCRNKIHPSTSDRTTKSKPTESSVMKTSHSDTRDTEF